MIIRKPYAFLIKNFRIIHGILFLLLGYLLIQSTDIFSFFNEFASNNAYLNTGNLASSYINLFTFIAIVLVALLTAVIYYILRLKNKERTFYVALFGYYIVLFITFIILIGVFNDIEINGISNESVRALRDVTLIVELPQLVFMFITLSRALGFNVKQFDFKKDLEELQIDTSDYEEVEINLGKNNYKYFRFFRKIMRQLKYFVLENKFFVTMISSIIVLTISLTIFLTAKVYNVNYKQNQELLANSLWYEVKDSYLAQSDLTGKEIAKGKYFLLVRIQINNKMQLDQSLDGTSFRLEAGRNLLIPKFNYGKEFVDIGEAFEPTNILSGTKKEYILVFELTERQLKKDYMLKIKNAERVGVGDINTLYKEVIVKPENINSDNDTGKYKIPSVISLEGTTLGKTTINAFSYDIGSSFKEKYRICVKDDCYDAIDIVRPTTVGKGELSVLKLKASIDVDEELYMKKYLGRPSYLFDYFGIITYRYEGKTKNYKAAVIDTDYDPDNYTYFEVPKELEDANKIEILLTIRGIKYTLVLK